MPYYFRAVAIDYDGTLADTHRPDTAVLDSLRDARSSGLKLLLVTGRILAELRADFPEVDGFFDRIVAENGAVLASPDQPPRPLAEPIPPALEEALARRSIPFRRGRVLLATEAAHAPAILEEIGRLGLECQILQNRGALMVLPGGTSKGSGLFEALGDLGISYHSTIAIGDAENDHSLLETSEIGVVPANAIESLKAQADVVLSEPDGRGVTRFLGGGLDGVVGVEPRRWQIGLGSTETGDPVKVPASRVNMLISGATGAGKSYLAGLVAEQLLDMEYTVCILDLEGDHVGLGTRRGALVVGGRNPLPTPDDLTKLLRHRFGSVVIDLSLQEESRKQAYAADVLTRLQGLRSETGLPHWVLVEEAHVSVGRGRARFKAIGAEQAGLCLVTYRPDQLLDETVSSADIAISVAQDGTALLRRHGQTEVTRFVVGCRATPHVRHLHKYAAARLPVERRFYFRDNRDLTGAVSGNLAEFTAELHRAPDVVLRHHAAGRDFSRWIRDVLRDHRLAHEVRALEERIASFPGRGSFDDVRDLLINTIERRSAGARM